MTVGNQENQGLASYDCYPMKKLLLKSLTFQRMEGSIKFLPWVTPLPSLLPEMADLQERFETIHQEGSWAIQSQDYVEKVQSLDSGGCLGHAGVGVCDPADVDVGQENLKLDLKIIYQKRF